MTVATSAGFKNPVADPKSKPASGTPKASPRPPAGPVADYSRSRELLDQHCDPIPFAKIGGLKLKYHAKLAASPVRRAMSPRTAAVLREIIEAAASSEQTADHAGLLRYADRRLILRAWISVRALAERIAVSERTVMRALKDLGPDGLGLIARERRYGCSSWTIVELPADWGSLAAVPPEDQEPVQPAGPAAAVEPVQTAERAEGPVSPAASGEPLAGIPEAAQEPVQTADGCHVERAKLSPHTCQAVTSNVTDCHHVVSSGDLQQEKNSKQLQQQRSSFSTRGKRDQAATEARPPVPTAVDDPGDAAALVLIAARRQALAAAGIGNPKRDELAAGPVSPERIAAIVADCKRRGKGQGVMILEIEAEALKPPPSPGERERERQEAETRKANASRAIITHLASDMMERAVQYFAELHGCTADAATIKASPEFAAWIGDPANVLDLDDRQLVSEIGEVLLHVSPKRDRIEQAALTHGLNAPELAVYALLGKCFPHAEAAEEATETPIFREFMSCYPPEDRGDRTAAARAWHSRKQEGIIGLITISVLQSWVRRWEECRLAKRFVRVPTAERFLLDHHTAASPEVADRRTAVDRRPIDQRMQCRDRGTIEQRRQQREQARAEHFAEQERKRIEAEEGRAQ